MRRDFKQKIIAWVKNIYTKFPFFVTVSVSKFAKISRSIRLRFKLGFILKNSSLYMTQTQQNILWISNWREIRDTKYTQFFMVIVVHSTCICSLSSFRCNQRMMIRYPVAYISGICGIQLLYVQEVLTHLIYICPRCSGDPFYIVTCYIKWVSTSLTYSITLLYKIGYCMS